VRFVFIFMFGDCTL